MGVIWFIKKSTHFLNKFVFKVLRRFFKAFWHLGTGHLVLFPDRESCLFFSNQEMLRPQKKIILFFQFFSNFLCALNSYRQSQITKINIKSAIEGLL
jgi:hypothetical protein